MSSGSLRKRARASLRFRGRRFLGVDSVESEQQNLVAVYSAAQREHEATHGLLAQRLASLEQRTTSIERQTAQRLSELESHFVDWHAQLAELARATNGKASLEELRREADRLRERIAAIADALREPPGAADDAHAMRARSADAPPVDAQATDPSARSANDGSRAAVVLAQAFYPALERQFRGTPTEIRDRLREYRDRLANLPAGRVADLGCGRGEWLELLREWGIDAVGVDSNALNVAALHEAGLDAVRADALDWLRKQPDASLGAVTAFHLVEHLPFEVLLALLDASRRALAPGGLLLLETPNPENLLVATQSFWLDPTHRKPLPPPLLEFAASWSGFECEAVLRLHPPEEGTYDIADVTLRGLVRQGRDYALIARRPRSGEAR
ncbi:MAG TPA: methyltransferase domain-containing protein [Zeimonas sp.]